MHEVFQHACRITVAAVVSSGPWREIYVVAIVVVRIPTSRCPACVVTTRRVVPRLQACRSSLLLATRVRDVPQLDNDVVYRAVDGPSQSAVISCNHRASFSALCPTMVSQPMLEVLLYSARFQAIQSSQAPMNARIRFRCRTVPAPQRSTCDELRCCLRLQRVDRCSTEKRVRRSLSPVWGPSPPRCPVLSSLSRSPE